MNDWMLRNDYDRKMYNEVYDTNEYAVPNDLTGWQVLDIGANIGCFSRLCAERGANVLAIEPDPNNFKVLLHNVQGLSIRCINAAVSDETKLADFYTGDDPTGHSLFKASHHTGSDVIECYPLRHFIRLQQSTETSPIDLVKIDAEGAEYVVIPTADFSLVKRLAIEFHGFFVPEPLKGMFACREKLRLAGFTETSWAPSNVPGCFLYQGSRE